MKKFLMLGAVAALLLALTGVTATGEKSAVLLPNEPDDFFVSKKVSL